MSNSESSNGNFSAIRGIPVKCACGCRVRKYTSTTPEIPGRPFYRCESMLKKDHLFKWVEEAMLEEIEAVVERVEAIDSGVNKLRSDVDSLILDIYDLHKQALEVKEEIRNVKIGFAVVVCVCVLAMVISKIW